MNIGIITYHLSHSYGAFFQCYATLKALQLAGHDVEIIDYRNKYEQSYMRIKKFDYKTIKRVIKVLIKEYVFRMKHLENKAFGDVVNMYGDAITQERYNNAKDMSKLEYDCLLLGSDQMWNLEISGGIDPVYLLQFGRAKRRISLATSMGSYCLDVIERKEFRSALKQFDFISVREEFAKKQLQSLVECEIEIVGDPTILLEQKQWKEMIPDKCAIVPKRPFILTFFVGGNYKAYKERICKLLPNCDMPIYCIQPSKIKVCQGYHVLSGVKPFEFLALINSAEYFFTDSFHGTCFGLYFEKNVIVLSNKNNPYRTKELMERLGLSARVDPESMLDVDKNIDYVQVNNKLENIRKHTMNWLDMVLKED